LENWNLKYSDNLQSVGFVYQGLCISIYVCCLVSLHQTLLDSSLALSRISLLIDSANFYGLMFIPIELASKTRRKRTLSKLWIDRNRRISLFLSPSFSCHCVCVLPHWATPNAFTSLASPSACEFALSTFPTLRGKRMNLFSRFL